MRTLVFLSTRASVAARGTMYTPPPDVNRFVSLVGGSSGVGDVADDHAYEVDLPADGVAWTFLPAATQALLTRLDASCSTLAKYSDGRIWMGVKSGLSKAFVIDDTIRQILLAANPESAEVIKPFIVGRDVRRYRVDGGDKYLLYMFHGVDEARYPAVMEHLEPFRADLEKRATEQAWYELQQPQYRFSRHMDAPKIVFPDIAKGPRFALDVAGHYGSNTIYFIPLEDYYLLGLLNSSLSRFYFQSVCAGLEGGGEVYLRFFGQHMEGFPVPRADDTDLQGAKARETLAQMAKARELLETRLATARTPLDAEDHRREVARMDATMDHLVYALYGLSDDEIALVEEGFPLA